MSDIETCGRPGCECHGGLAVQIMVAKAIFREGFHPADVASGLADKKWAEWDEDRVRAFKQAGAALLALQAHAVDGSPKPPNTIQGVTDEMIEAAHMAARPLLIGKGTCRAMIEAALQTTRSETELEVAGGAGPSALEVEAGNGRGFR